MYECTLRLPCLSFRSSKRALNSACGSSNVCLNRDLKTSNDLKTNESCSLRPKAQVFARPAKFDCDLHLLINDLRALVVSSSSTNHLSRESSSAALYLEMSIFSDSVVDVSVSTRWQQLAAVSTNQTVEHSVLSTALSVKTLVGEATLPFPVQRQIHSE